MTAASMNRGRETVERRVDHVTRLLGDLVGGLLTEADVTDIILNPDGKLWVTRLERDSECVGTMTAPQAEALIAAIASTLHIVATRDSPIVEGELLIDGSRFEGVVPPIVSAPTFAIRRKASAVFPLARYVERGQMTERQKGQIEAAVVGRKNILAVGGTGAGKSTLVNAIIDAIVRLAPRHRIVGIEEDSHFVIDSGATSFVPLGRHLVTAGVAEILQERGRHMIAHAIVSGGAELFHCVRGFDAMATQFPSKVGIIVWLNEHHGPIDDGSNHFEDTPVYQKHKDRISGVVRLSRLNPATYGKNLAAMIARGQTFSEAREDSSLYIQTRQRLVEVQRPIWAQLDAVL